MARIWQEGFEIRRHSGHFAELYSIFPSAVATTSGRLHGFSWDGSNTLQGFRTLALANHQTYTAGAACQINAAESTARIRLLTFLDNGTDQIGAWVKGQGSSIDDYRVEVWKGNANSGGTLLDTSDLILGGDGYQYFEFQAVIAPAGGSWELRMNGAVISIGTGNTRNTANSYCNQLWWAAETQTADEGTSRFDYDDIYLNDGSGSVNNGFSGDTVIEGLLPSGAGSLSEWEAETNGIPSASANYLMVDDVASSTPDNDNTYVTSNVVGATDLYTWEDLQFLTGQVQAIMAVARARIEATGARVLGLRYKDISAAQADFAQTRSVNTAVYSEFTFIQELNPTTSSLFSIAQLNGMELGPKIVS